MSARLELTDEQRRLVENQAGQPIDVVDPDTLRTYVLVASEVFEQFRPLLERTPQSGAVSSSPPDRLIADTPLLRQRIRELPTPPEVAAEARRYCTALGQRGAGSIVRMEDQMKLQHYYGGQWIAYLRTREGPVVVAASRDLNDPVFEKQLSRLTGEERRSAVMDSPTRLFDEESEILTPFPDESQNSP